MESETGNDDTLSTTVAFDETGRRYKAADIGQPWFEARLAGTPAQGNLPAVPGIRLHDVSYDPVSCVKAHIRADGTNVRAHFRVQGARSGNRIGSGEPNDPTHEKVIEGLRVQLNQAGANISFTTTAFGDYDAHHTIWRCPKGSIYQWVREPETRQWFPGQRYIQPDLYGFDASRRSAGPTNKSVVIEVIRSHEPEHETYDRLVELSNVNHLVVFYFCHPEKKGSWLGKAQVSGTGAQSSMTLRTELYLLDGTFYKSGKPFKSHLAADEIRAEIFKEFKRVKRL